MYYVVTPGSEEGVWWPTDDGYDGRTAAMTALYRAHKREPGKPLALAYPRGGDWIVTEVDLTVCQWWASCNEPAVDYADHPILGPVPVCVRH